MAQTLDGLKGALYKAFDRAEFHNSRGDMAEIAKAIVAIEREQREARAEQPRQMIKPKLTETQNP